MAQIIGTPESDDLSSSTPGYELLGFAGDDTLSATATGITLNGGSGNDTLISSGGATLIGGAGDDVINSNGPGDTLSYAEDPAGVTVDLLEGFALDGTNAIDILGGIDNVTGSEFGDTLTGDDFQNVLQGGAGVDTLEGSGGADVFKYSFNFTPGGGGNPPSFTDFFAQNGGSVESGKVAFGTSQGQFSSLYTQWLEMLLRDYGLGTAVLDLGQNSGPDGSPVIENMTGEFGERESFTWQSGSAKKSVVHERWYSDTWSSGSGEDTVSSNDGFDTIVDFNFGEDKLEFNGLANLGLDQFITLFDVNQSDVDGNGSIDTVVSLADDTWGVTLLNVSGHGEADVHATSVFS